MKIKVLFSVVLVIALGALSIGALAHAEVVTSPDTSSSINDPHLLAGGENSEQPEFWTVDEFKNWMEQQRDANQELADKGDKSFCEKMPMAIMYIAHGRKKTLIHFTHNGKTSLS